MAGSSRECWRSWSKSFLGWPVLGAREVTYAWSLSLSSSWSQQMFILEMYLFSQKWRTRGRCLSRRRDLSKCSFSKYISLVNLSSLIRCHARGGLFALHGHWQNHCLEGSSHSLSLFSPLLRSSSISFSSSSMVVCTLGWLNPRRHFYVYECWLCTEIDYRDKSVMTASLEIQLASAVYSWA